MLLAYFTGLLTGWSLIVAIGAQNAFVIRQGLTRKHILPVVAICAAADALLIAVGVAGLGAVIKGLPWMLEGIRWFGVAYLTWFGVKSIRAAFKNDTLDARGEASGSLKSAVLTVLAMTFLNPHVYLDTVIFVGSIANQFGDLHWQFAFGAMTASVVWFFALGYGSRAMSRFMSKAIFWRVLDSVIAVIMFAIAATLAFAKLG
ncbi:MAG: LysE/ArgO family amino acid transporter [Micrococcales bacterium]